MKEATIDSWQISKKTQTIFSKKSQLSLAIIVYALLVIFILTPAAALATPEEVIVGGHSVGIVLQNEGAYAVGFTPVTLADGSNLYPARDAGIEIGDFITAIDGEKVTCDTDIATKINEYTQDGGSITIEILRDGDTKNIDVTPAKALDGTWQIGLFIRDASAGIGTLTFCDPDTNVYGALGHEVEVENLQTGDEVGEILAAPVEYLKVAEAGSPGEKVGTFDDDHLQGSIITNSEQGLFGILEETPANPIYEEPIPVAEISEITTGKATILTVLDGETIQEFEVEIEKIQTNTNSEKNMIIKITDPTLLEATGGIIQGMSGSPIIQNGKLVGAITHVFVNDPTTGYGIFIENMLEAAEAVA